MPISPGGASLAGGALGFLGSMIGLGAQRNQNKLQWQHDQEMYNMQKQDRIEFWNMENQYNSPTMQMQRLKEAGLNPNLVYGNGATATGGTIQGPDARSTDISQNMSPYFQGMANNLGSMINNIYDLKLKDAQVNQTNSTIELQAAQIKLTQSQKYLNELEAIRRRTDNKYQIETLDKRIENTRLEVDKTLSDIDNIRSGTRKNQTDVLIQTYVQKNLVANTKATIDANSRENQKQNLTLQQMQENIAKTIIEKVKIVADTNIAGITYKNLTWDNVLKQVQYNFSQKDFEFYKKNGYKIDQSGIEWIIKGVLNDGHNFGDKSDDVLKKFGRDAYEFNKKYNPFYFGK